MERPTVSNQDLGQVRGLLDPSLTTHSPVNEYEEVLDFPPLEMLVPLPMPVRDGLPTQQRFLLSIRVVRGV